MRRNLGTKCSCTRRCAFMYDVSSVHSFMPGAVLWQARITPRAWGHAPRSSEHEMIMLRPYYGVNNDAVVCRTLK